MGLARGCEDGIALWREDPSVGGIWLERLGCGGDNAKQGSGNQESTPGCSGNKV